MNLKILFCIFLLLSCYTVSLDEYVDSDLEKFKNKYYDIDKFQIICFVKYNFSTNSIRFLNINLESKADAEGIYKLIYTNICQNNVSCAFYSSNINSNVKLSINISFFDMFNYQILTNTHNDVTTDLDSNSICILRNKDRDTIIVPSTNYIEINNKIGNIPVNRYLPNFTGQNYKGGASIYSHLSYAKYTYNETTYEIYYTEVKYFNYSEEGRTKFIDNYYSNANKNMASLFMGYIRVGPNPEKQITNYYPFPRMTFNKNLESISTVTLTITDLVLLQTIKNFIRDDDSSVSTYVKCSTISNELNYLFVMKGNNNCYISQINSQETLTCNQDKFIDNNNTVNNLSISSLIGFCLENDGGKWMIFKTE